MNTRARRWTSSVRRRLVLLAVAGFAVVGVLVLGSPVVAVNTRAFVLDTSTDLAAGVLDRVAVTSDGSVVLGAETQRLAPDPAAQAFWCFLDMDDGSALAGSGIDGRIYRVDGTGAGGHIALYAETGSVVVTSLARGADGTVYAATLPDGKIFRVRPPQNGHPQTAELWVQLPSAQDVWAIAWDRTRQALLAATGPDGKLFAIDHAGHATVVFDSDEPHLYSLAIGADGTVYTGAGGGHAILYAIGAHGEATSVARFAGDEVKALVIVGDTLYVAANEFPEAPEPTRRTSVNPSRVVTPGGPGGARPRAGHGSVYRVSRTGISERIYHNADAHVMALEVDSQHNNEVLAGLGVGGRVIAIAPDRTSRIAFDADENQVLALDLTGRAHVFGTGDSGAVYRVLTTQPQGATWTSKLLDATVIAQWGAVRWRGLGGLDWESRSGNADPPDNTWTPWHALTSDGVIQSPSARYLQVRARWREAATVMRYLEVFYLPTNQRPVLTEVSAEVKVGEPRPQPVKIGWKVENPDSDSLRYRLRFRGDTEQTWRPVLRQGEFVTTTSYEWPVDGLPEGFYRVQVEASDEASNPETEALRDTRASEPVLVDNTPPRVTVAVAGAEVRGEAVDGASAVTRVEVSVDTQDWRPLRATDGVFDQRTEAFRGPLPALNDGGEHVVMVRAIDEAGNVGSASATFRAAGAAPVAAQPAAVGRPARRR